MLLWEGKRTKGTLLVTNLHDFQISVIYSNRKLSLRSLNSIQVLPKY